MSITPTGAEVGLFMIAESRGAAIIGGGLAFLTAVFLSRWATLSTRLRINTRESMGLALSKSFREYNADVIQLLEFESYADLQQAYMTCSAVMCFLGALLLALPSGVFTSLAYISDVRWMVYSGIGLLCASIACALLGLVFAALELKSALASAKLDSRTIMSLRSLKTVDLQQHAD